MAYLNMVGELTGTIPGLSPFLAQKYLNRALRDIYNERTWSFLTTDGLVVCPTTVTSGTVAFTQYDYQVTLDTDASAAIASQLLTGAVPGILNLQMRFGSQPTTGGIYTIVNYDATTPTAVVLTLDRIIAEPTATASNYQIYRCFVKPPIDDFLRWESLVDIANAIGITGDRLRQTSAGLDRRDPQRAAQGLAYYLASWGGNRTETITINSASADYVIPSPTQSAGSPFYELWPHPTQGQTFYCRIRRRGAFLDDDLDELPDGIEESLVISRALGWHIYQFCIANAANFPQFKNASLVLPLIANAKAEYNKLLLDAKRNDDEKELMGVWNRGHGLRVGRWDFKQIGDVPIDSNYLQSHLVRW